MSDAKTSPRPYVPNRLALPGTGVPVNLLNDTRYIGDGYPTQISATVTDSYTTNTLNGGPASRINSGANTNWFVLRTTQGSGVPSGTYTIAASVKSNTGSNQTFQLYANATPSGVALTATTSWQRFKYTFTGSPSGNQIGIANNSTAVDLVVTDMELYAGSSDLGPEPLRVGNLYIGQDDFDTTHGTLSGGVADMSATDSFGRFEFVSVPNFASGVTVLAIAEKVTAWNIADINSMFSPIGTGTPFTSDSATLDYGGAPQFFWANQSFAGSYLSAAQWLLNGSSWHSFGKRYDLTNLNTWIDDGIFQQTAQGTGTPPSFTDWWFANIAYHGGYGGKWKFAAMAAWPRNLTNSEMRQAATIMWGSINPATASRQPVNLIFNFGDSIGGGNGQYMDQSAPNWTFAAAGYNQVIIALSTWSGTYYPIILQALPPTRVAGSNYTIVYEETHDISGGYVNYGGSRTTYLNALSAAFDTARAAGFKVVYCTLLPRTVAAAPTWNTERNIINPIIRGWVGTGPGTHIDAVIDFANDATMGCDACASNTTYYMVDGIHPNGTGETFLSGIVYPVLNSLL